jgi:transcription antitermination factor NusG
MTEQADYSWYIVYTRPRSEKKLAAALAKKGIEFYLPLLKTRSQWSDRIKWVEKPAFNSYLFVKINYERDHVAVLKIPYAVRFVTIGQIPAQVSENDINLLRIAIAEFYDNLVIRNTSEFSLGQKVLIKVGPFRGKEAIIEQIQGENHVLVHFPALNKTIQVRLPVGDLETPGEKLLT